MKGQRKFLAQVIQSSRTSLRIKSIVSLLSEVEIITRRRSTKRSRKGRLTIFSHLYRQPSGAKSSGIIRRTTADVLWRQIPEILKRSFTNLQRQVAETIRRSLASPPAPGRLPGLIDSPPNAWSPQTSDLRRIGISPIIEWFPPLLISPPKRSPRKRICESQTRPQKSIRRVRVDVATQTKRRGRKSHKRRINNNDFNKCNRNMKYFCK